MMPDDWLRNSLLYEINTWVWLREWSQAAGRSVTLGEVPEEAWDRLADLGVSAVWLMGVWERSPVGVALALRNRALLRELRQSLPNLRTEDIVGSPYCVRRFEVDPHLGGPAGLAAARQALAQREIRLVLDFVPNHVAPDHPWVSTHPDWLIRGSPTDLRRTPGAFLDVGGQVFARGRDPYFPPWSDVLQLNAFSQDLRDAVVTVLRSIAAQCDGVRCDMAMLMLNHVFARTWGQRAGALPAEDYWRYVIPAVKSSNPEFRFVAEAYWDLETSLLEQGFDACYDKGLYDRLAHSSAESIREHLLRYSEIQDRLVRFLENHDEPRAAQVFPWPKAFAATVVLMTLPGVRLLHEGQLQGRTLRTPLHLGRRSAETENSVMAQRYPALFRLAARRVFRMGRWFLCDTSGWPDNLSHRHLLSWCWRDGDERWLIVANYSQETVQGRVHLPWEDLTGRLWRLVDPLQGAAYERHGDELASLGLFVALDPWACHLLRFEDRRHQAGELKAVHSVLTTAPR
jgi:glycosidase